MPQCSQHHPACSLHAHAKSSQLAGYNQRLRIDQPRHQRRGRRSRYPTTRHTDTSISPSHTSSNPVPDHTTTIGLTSLPPPRTHTDTAIVAPDSPDTDRVELGQTDAG